MSLRARVRRLEGRIPTPTAARSGPTTLDEIRALEENIARLETEIRAAGGTVEPEPPIDSLEDLEAIEREIERLELEASRENPL